MVTVMNAITRRTVAALAAVLVLTAAGCDNGPRADENDPWSVVTAYIDAVNASHADVVRDLVDPVYDPDDEIAGRIKRLGGRSLYYETLQFHGVGQAGLTSVDLTLRSGNPADKATYRDTLSLTRSNSRWYLILGRHR
jgi:hypothetical protein